MIRSKLLLVVFVFGLCGTMKAQEFDSLSDPRIEQAKGMVQTMAYYFNLLGGKRASIGEKETIINESYLKLFANEKVQVEDDLQEDRSTVIYKDIQAYLKDIDFFFEEAYFEFQIDTVQKLLKDDNTPYYRVDLLRNLEAVSLGGDSVNTTKRRYVELNMDGANELKIASIYTTKISKEKQLREWWSSLTLEWKKVFQTKLGLFYDSLSTDELFNLVTIDSLDISGNDLILDLEPIYQLTGLKHLKISNTWVNDLRPLLSINKLQSLDVSNTSVYDLQYLKYHKDIRKLNLSNSHVEDFSLLKNFDKLKELNLNGIAGTGLNFITELTGLEVLRLEDAKGLNNLDFSTLRQLKQLYLKNGDLLAFRGTGLSQLSMLDISGTELTDLTNLQTLTGLETLRIENTGITELEGIIGLSRLKVVYANGTSLSDASVEHFNAQSKALLITNSDQLMAWWNGLPGPLKTRLSDPMGTYQPAVEQLSALARIDSLDASNAGLKSLEPLSRFQSLKYLSLNGNRLSKLDGSMLSSKLIALSLNDTDINQVSNLERLSNLEMIEARNTGLTDLTPFGNLPRLQVLDLDGSSIAREEVADLIKKRPLLKIRFRSAELTKWWDGLAPSLKREFAENAKISNRPDADELHTLIAREELKFQSISLTESFNASLELFYRLKSIEFQRVKLNSINDLPDLPHLEGLALLQMPVSDLTGLALKYPELKQLNISNTAVEDLRPLSGLTTLELLNCSGTNVKRFRGLEGLQNLREIDCSNTKVFRLDRLTELKNLQKITCFNTGLRQNDIDKLLESLPDVEIIFY